MPVEREYVKFACRCAALVTTVHQSRDGGRCCGWKNSGDRKATAHAKRSGCNWSKASFISMHYRLSAEKKADNDSTVQHEKKSKQQKSVSEYFCGDKYEHGLCVFSITLHFFVFLIWKMCKRTHVCFIPELRCTSSSIIFAFFCFCL